MLETGAVHPKMVRLQDILTDHFAALRDAAAQGCGPQSSKSTCQVATSTCSCVLLCVWRSRREYTWWAVTVHTPHHSIGRGGSHQGATAPAKCAAMLVPGSADRSYLHRAVGAPACRGGGEEGAAERLGKAGGRVIIFTTLRESVSSIVALLKKKSPLITPRCLAS